LTLYLSMQAYQRAFLRPFSDPSGRAGEVRSLG
jgi:hypothetical protein